MKNARGLVLPWVLIIAVTACNNKQKESPFAQVLNNRPFSVLTDSIADFPKNDELFFRRAVLLNTNNLAEPALADFIKAWSLKKDEKYALGIGNLLLEKKPDSAVFFLSDALNILPRSLLLR